MNKKQELYKKLCQEHFVIAGPCVLESYESALEIAFALKQAAEQANLLAVFKASFDKANRTSMDSFRGPGIDQGLEWLARIGQKTGLPLITDIHEPAEAQKVASCVDILQIPAFLCRQTSLLEAAAKTGAIINIKKGQFLAPWDMQNVLDKVRQCGNQQVLLTERGASFGYNNLVVDMRSFPIMNKMGVPSVIDATHSVQLPGGQGQKSGGDRNMVPTIALAAVGAGAHGVFLECHQNPEQALCDGPNSIYLSSLAPLLQKLSAVWRVVDE